MTAAYTFDNSMGMLAVRYGQDARDDGTNQIWRDEIDALPRRYITHDVTLDTPHDAPEYPYLLMAYPRDGRMTPDELDQLTALIDRVYAEEALP